MPWWGWLITAVIVLVALYGVAFVVFAGKVFNRASRTFDDIETRNQWPLPRDPFDDPFFNRPASHNWPHHNR
jgi:hypothetical protein